MLTAIIGGRSASRTIVREALGTGGLVLDCANVCDPYAYPDVEAGSFERVFVMGFDMLTSLNDALSEAPMHLARIGTQRLYVTSTRRLYTYHNDDEDASVRARAWTLMRTLSKRYQVIVAVEQGSVDEAFAHLHAETRTEASMGHTVSSQRRVVEDMNATLKRYRRALRKEDQAVFDTLTNLPYQHVSSMSYASSIHTWALYLLSILIEQEKALEEIRSGREPKREQQEALGKLH